MKDNYYPALEILEPEQLQVLRGELLPPHQLFEAETMHLGAHAKLILCERNFAKFEIGTKDSVELWTFELAKDEAGDPEFRLDGTDTRRKERTSFDELMWHRAAELILAIRECHARGTLKRQSARDRRLHAERPGM